MTQGLNYSNFANEMLRQLQSFLLRQLRIFCLQDVPNIKLVNLCC